MNDSHPEESELHGNLPGFQNTSEEEQTTLRNVGSQTQELSPDTLIFQPTLRRREAGEISVTLTPFLHERTLAGLGRSPESFSTPHQVQHRLSVKQLESWTRFTRFQGPYPFDRANSDSAPSAMADEEPDDTGGGASPGGPQEDPTERMNRIMEFIAHMQEITVKQNETLEQIKLKELRLKEDKLEEYRKTQERLKEEASKREQASQSIAGIDRKCLPMMKETDDVLTFLDNFELSLTEMSIPDKLWLPLLRTQVTGPVVNILSECKERTWAETKGLILQRFAYTPEGLRMKLRGMRWSHKQSVCCLLSDIRKKVKQWFTVAKVDTIEDVIDLIAGEQLGNAIPPQLRLDVLARQPSTALNFAVQADELLCFKQYFFPKTQQATGRYSQGHKPGFEVRKVDPRAQSQPHTDTPREPRATMSIKDVTCFTCQERGHYSFDCPKRAKATMTGTFKDTPEHTPKPKTPSKQPRKSAVPTQPQPKMQGISFGAPEIFDNIEQSDDSEGEESQERDGGIQNTLVVPVRSRDNCLRASVTPLSCADGTTTGCYASTSDSVVMHGATSTGRCGELGDNIQILGDPRDFLNPEQQKWMSQTYTHDVIVRKGDRDLVVAAFIDTGAELCSVSSQCIDESCILRKCQLAVNPYNPRKRVTVQAPVAKIWVKYKGFEGYIYALVHDHYSSPMNFIIGGNLLHSEYLTVAKDHQSEAKTQITLVQTRSQTKDLNLVDPVQDIPMVSDMPSDTNGSQTDMAVKQSDTYVESRKDSDISDDIEFLCIKPDMEFKKEQLSCPTLADARRLADLELTLGPGRQTRFCWKGPEGQKLLYREKLMDNNVNVATQLQLVVPNCYREEVLKMAHDGISGHVGIKKTQIKVTNHLFWPDVSKDVKKYCTSCDTCQRVGYSTDTTKAEMEEFPLTGAVFSTLELDIFGPLQESSTGKKYLVCFTDPVSKWVEIVATSSITAKQVAKAFLEVASRIGWPNVLVSDQAKSFTSELVSKICELTGVKQQFSVAYHPQSHGAIERVQQTLYKMLQAFIQENKRNWSEAIPYILYAYRTSPHESLGWFTPSDVVLGRNLRGPLELLKAQWEGTLPDPSMPVAKYIQELQKKLKNIRDITTEHLQKAQKKYKAYHDAKARPRSFQVGDSVLVLDPVRHNKLQVHWLGPGVIEKKLGNVNYVVRMTQSEKKPKIYHANRLKPYVHRSANLLNVKLVSPETLVDANPDLLQAFQEAGDYSEVYMESDIPSGQQEKMYEMLKGKAAVFVNTPGRTSVIKHKLKVTDDTPIRSSPYRVIGDQARQIEEELQEMLNLGIIQPSKSPWASPVVIVPKKTPDGQVQSKIRFCVDYRRLNQVTVADPYPMPRADDLIEKIARSKFLSCLDLSAGYWQIELDPETRERCAFVTHKGTFEFLRLPFGLCNAGRTFQRLMDLVLQDLPFAQAYLDDIIIFSDTFEDHLTQVEIVLQRLQEAGLTVKASKCQWLKGKVVYLGHWVGSGTIEPLQAKVASVSNWPIPENKKQIQSFLGLVGYYRRFIPHFSQIAAPLTDLTRKRMPIKVEWTKECQYAFDRLKKCLVEYPILIPPDFDQPFVIQTDASEFGLGCVLLQKKDDLLHPVSFFSKKLLPREKNYSVPEKECLGIVWTLTRLRPYLWGRRFVLQTDHQALKWLNRLRGNNQRLLRWSLALQDFDFEVEYIPGSKNILADSLSRMYYNVPTKPEENIIMDYDDLV